jgi:hypothetical protein
MILLPLYLIASDVKATLDRPLIYKGDSVVLSIEAEGSDIDFPMIDEISGFKVLGSSNSQNITSINGKMSQKFIQSYTFAPTKSIEIPSFEVEVDGKIMKTSPLKLRVESPKAAGKNSSIQLEMKVSKRSSFVGEPITLDILFKRDPNREFAKVEIAQPELDSFWAKKLPDTPSYSENGYIVQKYSYLLFPQEDGNFTIPATFAKLGIKIRQKRSMFNDPFFDDPFSNDPFFSAFSTSSIKWQKLFSNEVNINVKPLPDKLELFGNFNIKAKVDKRAIPANKALNLTLIVDGEGNIEDIKKFSLDISNGVVYADEPIIKGVAKDGTYRGAFSQKIAIVADQNYTIPAFSLSYFDKKSGKKKVIKTKPIDIIVTGGSERPKIETNDLAQVVSSNKNNDVKDDNRDKIESIVVKTSNPYEKFIYLFSGIVLGALIAYLFLDKISKIKVKKDTDIVKKIERAKDDKTLFELLLPYANRDKLIKKELDKLEKNIYKNGNEVIDKDAILDFFEPLIMQ